MKGIYKHRRKFKVRKYGYYRGLYSTYEEAVEAIKKIDEEMEVKKNFEKYLYHKKWLQDRGLL